MSREQSGDLQLSAFSRVGTSLLEEINPSDALEKFLSTKPEVGVFGPAARLAAIEIAKEDGMQSYVRGLDQRASDFGWLRFDGPNELQERLASAVNYSAEHGHGLFFRGGKMPDAKMGSFGALEGGVHLTPLADTAQGYAASINSETGVGRLLRLGADTYADTLGFLSVWDIPIETKMWGNFHYEDSLRGTRAQSEVSVRNMYEDIQKIAKLPSSAFERVSISGEGEGYSQAENELRKKFAEPYYEAIATEADAPKDLFLQQTDAGSGQPNLIKINTENPKWDRWMARVSEANLRDFFEILPLNGSVNNLTRLKENARRGGATPAQLKLIEAVSHEADTQLALSVNAPWKCATMQQAREFAASLPYISQSETIGSRSGKIKYPPNVQKVIDACKVIALKQYDKIPSIMSLPEQTSAILDSSTLNEPIRSLAAITTVPNPRTAKPA